MAASSIWLAELMDAGRRGDSAALGQLLGRYQPWLLVLARLEMGKRLQAKFDAADVVQQALLEACRGFPQFRGLTEAELMAWLRQILGHALGHEIRRYQGTQRRDLGREVSLEESLADSSQRLGNLLTASGSSPSQHLARQEQEGILAVVLARLPDDYREVIVLRNLEGLSHEEVAQRMKRSLGAVRMLWVRALACLRQILTEGSPPQVGM
jgi:RNA polymerase sigma-70 factor, ECF subfamily